MIISEKLVCVKQSHVCLECHEPIPVGAIAKALVNYNKASKLISSLYLCRDCLDRRFHEEVHNELSSLPNNIQEAYEEHLHG